MRVFSSLPGRCSRSRFSEKNVYPVFLVGTRRLIIWARWTPSRRDARRSPCSNHHTLLQNRSQIWVDGWLGYLNSSLGSDIQSLEDPSCNGRNTCRATRVDEGGYQPQTACVNRRVVPPLTHRLRPSRVTLWLPKHGVHRSMVFNDGVIRNQAIDERTNTVRWCMKTT